MRREVPACDLVRSRRPFHPGVRLACCGVLVLAGCGRPPAAVTGTTGPDPKAPAPGAEPASDVPTPPGNRPCLDPTPIVLFGKATGYARCANGLLHRRRQAVCPSTVPRAGTVRETLLEVQRRSHERRGDPEAPWVAPIEDGECTSDADCTARPHGYCTRSDPSGVPDRTACAYGCTKDAECPPQHICVCGDPVGECVMGSCTGNAQCGPGLACAEYESPGCTLTTGFACQTAADRCAVDGDCAHPTGRCVMNNGVRSCEPHPDCHF